MLKIPSAAACGLVAVCLVAPHASAQPRPEADLCAVAPGAQPLLPARLMEGMGVTHMPVTTSSDDARKFFNQGVSQMHSFWFLESERSFLQAATQINDPAVGFLPRVLAAVLVAWFAGGWAVERMAQFVAGAMQRMAQHL